PLARDLLDVDAALGGGDHDDLLRDAVDDHPQVELAVYPARPFDQHALHALACVAGLRRDERRANHLVGQVRDLPDRVGELHAATLAAAAGVDLRLDDPPAAAELLGDARRRAVAIDNLARRHRDAVALEELLRLVLVDVPR